MRGLIKLGIITGIVTGAAGVVAVGALAYIGLKKVLEDAAERGANEEAEEMGSETCDESCDNAQDAPCC